MHRTWRKCRHNTQQRTHRTSTSFSIGTERSVVMSGSAHDCCGCQRVSRAPKVQLLVRMYETAVDVTAEMFNSMNDLPSSTWSCPARSKASREHTYEVLHRVAAVPREQRTDVRSMSDQGSVELVPFRRRFQILIFVSEVLHSDRTSYLCV